MDDKAFPFRDALRRLLNEHSVENASGTPDFVLARYLDDCLKAFEGAVKARAAYHDGGLLHDPVK